MSRFHGHWSANPDLMPPGVAQVVLIEERLQFITPRDGDAESRHNGKRCFIVGTISVGDAWSLPPLLKLIPLLQFASAQKDHQDGIEGGASVIAQHGEPIQQCDDPRPVVEWQGRKGRAA